MMTMERHCSRQYEFRVVGHVGEPIRRAFTDVGVAIDGADTLLTVGVPEWAAIYGLVEQIERLGLELRGIRPVMRDGDT